MTGSIGEPVFYCSKIRQKFESDEKFQYNKNVKKYKKL